MRRVGSLIVGLAASVACAELLAQNPGGPVYQRQRVGGAEQALYGRFPVYRPRPFPPGIGVPIVPPRASIASGSFQRPYPYHLDYYKQRYNGGYEPYQGNLYGPPSVVGTQPFAFSEYPSAQPQGNAAPTPPTSTPPATDAASPAVCPHCQQPLELHWRTQP